MQQVNSSFVIWLIGPFENTIVDYWWANSKIFFSWYFYLYLFLLFYWLWIFITIMSYERRKMHFWFLGSQNNSEYLISWELLRKMHSFTILFLCLTAPWLIMPTSNFLQLSHSCFCAFFLYLPPLNWFVKQQPSALL